jgi:hypothetical protein
MSLDETRLLEKLRAVEALHARPGSAGEREAAGAARERILGRLSELAASDPAVEHQFSMPDLYARSVFVALLRRYGIRPYRYKRQRYTTVMAKMPRRFLEETLWPEFEALSQMLHEHLSEVAVRMVGEVIHADVSEVEIEEQDKQLTTGRTHEPRTPKPSAPARGNEPAAGGAAAASKKVGRNAPCPCGSGKKHKRCCLATGR